MVERLEVPFAALYNYLTVDFVRTTEYKIQYLVSFL